MSLPSRPVRAVPEETSRVAHVTFPHGHVYLRMPEAFGAMLADDEFADLFPSRGQQRQVSESNSRALPIPCTGQFETA
jgi:hypothetical protein